MMLEEIQGALDHQELNRHPFLSTSGTFWIVAYQMIFRIIYDIYNNSGESGLGGYRQMSTIDSALGTFIMNFNLGGPHLAMLN